MIPELAREVKQALNIEAGEPLYSLRQEGEEWSVCRGEPATCIITEEGGSLVVKGTRGRGIRYSERRGQPVLERFDWRAIHLRCERLGEQANGVGRV